MEQIYTASAVATGAGRAGQVASLDGAFDADLAIPREMGGPGGSLNPEMLFAAGFAGSYLAALRQAALDRGIEPNRFEVVADVCLTREGSGFSLSTSLEVCLPDIEPPVAEALAERANQLCAYCGYARGSDRVRVTFA